MIFQGFLVIGTLLSWTEASSMRVMQEKSLGEAFLAIAKNYSKPTNTVFTTETKSASFFATLEASLIDSLASKLDLLCTQQGYISSKSQSGNADAASSYVLSCSVPEENTDAFEDAVIALLEDTLGDNSTYSYTWNIYTNSYTEDVDAKYKAQKAALELLLGEAETIEQVLLIFTDWQNLAALYGDTTPTKQESSFSINLSENYVYPPILDPPFFFNGTFDVPPIPAPAPIPVPVPVPVKN
jgi:hypothetical protein